MVLTLLVLTDGAVWAGDDASLETDVIEPVGVVGAETTVSPADPDDGQADLQPAGTTGEESTAGTTQPALPTRKQGKPLLGREKDKEHVDTSSLLHQMLAMVVVIALLGGVSWYVMKRGLPKLKGVGSRRVQVEETTYLASRHSLHLVRVGSRRLLVASGREGVRSLGDVSDAFQTDGADEGFRKALEGSLAGTGGREDEA